MGTLHAQTPFLHHRTPHTPLYIMRLPPTEPSSRGASRAGAWVSGIYIHSAFPNPTRSPHPRARPLSPRHPHPKHGAAPPFTNCTAPHIHQPRYLTRPYLSPTPTLPSRLGPPVSRIPCHGGHMNNSSMHNTFSPTLDLAPSPGMPYQSHFHLLRDATNSNVSCIWV